MYKKIISIIFALTLIIGISACDFIEEEADVYTKIFDKVELLYKADDKRGAVYHDIGLIRFLDAFPEAQLTWSSSHPHVVTDGGQVFRQQQSMWVVLTLKVTIEDDFKTKEYPVYIIGLENNDVKDTFEVTFDFSNGTEPVVIEVVANKTATPPADPYKEGYRFLHWAVDGAIYNFNTPITGNITITATYELLNENSRRLTFYDEFEGDFLDTNKWEYHEGTGSEYGIWAWGNEERQYYTRDNIEVSDGLLKIHAKQETGRATGGHFKYTSGKIVSYETNQRFRDNEDGFRQTYGRFEARIKAPLGDGFWPAFWLMPAQNTYGNGWPYNGEIDIVELRGRKPFEISSAVHFSNVGPHFGGYNGGHHSYLHQNYMLTGGVAIDDFNVYAVEWQPGKIEFSVNDVVYHTRTSNDFINYEGDNPFDQPFYIIINLAIGGHFDGFREPSDDDFPAMLEVDWVRVYEPLT